ncbi:MAG: hypothetical protein V4490_00520 [Pseudomonadota bacterium]
MSPFTKKMGYKGLRLGLSVVIGTAALYLLNVPMVIGTLVTLLFLPLYGLVHAGLFSVASVAPVASTISFIGIQIFMNPLFVCATLGLLVIPSLFSLIAYCFTGESRTIPSLWSYLADWISGPSAPMPEAKEPEIVIAVPSPPTTPDEPHKHVRFMGVESPVSPAMLLSQGPRDRTSPCPQVITTQPESTNRSLVGSISLSQSR